MKFLATIRNWLTDDVGWKIFSVLLAVAIWLTVSRILTEPGAAGTNSGGSTFTYDNRPVYIVAAAADVHLYRVAPATVRVTVTGSPEAMAVLQANQVRATVNLTGMDSAKELKRTVDVSVPAGVTVVSVVPSKVGVIVPPAK